jgi:YesN/AraC family two-component response regulator
VTVRVLVVDDQAMVRAGFAALLDAQPDIEVVGQAADGEEGVRLALETSPDVVLMDVRMPVLDGIAAAQAMADLDYKPRVILMTGDPSSLYRANTTELNIFAVLEKPVPMRTLSRFILKALG